MAEVHYLAGCDIGTGGTKAVVIDLEGKVLGDHYVEYPLITKKDAWEKYPGMKAEHNPMMYWESVSTCLKESIRKAKIDPAFIGAVSISALAPACICVDRDLKPLANGHIWMDRRGTDQSAWLKDEFGVDKSFDISANTIDPYFNICKLMWERDNRPDLYNKTYKVQTAADFPVLMLTGKAVTDYSNASLYGIAFDIRKRQWRTDILEQIGIDPEKLPQVFPCDEVIGEVSRIAASTCGLAPGTPVVAGTVDCNAAWVASGVVEDGDTSLVLGSAGIIGIVHEKDTFTKNMISIPHTADSHSKYTTICALVAGGASMRYFRDVFASKEKRDELEGGPDAYDVLNKLAAKSPVGAKGIVYLPYLSGERTPIWDTSARGLYFGFGMDHERSDFIRAMMEGVGFGFYHNFEMMKASGVSIKRPIIVSEGGAKSPLWRQIIADVLNEPLLWDRESKGAPVGNAINAGIGVGVFTDYAVAKTWSTGPNKNDLTEPNRKNHEKYMEYYQIYRDLYDRNKGLFESLGNIQKS